MLFILGIFLIFVGMAAAWLEKSQYAVPYAGRFGAATNGAAVIILGTFLAASEIYDISVGWMIFFLVFVLLLWLLMNFVIKKISSNRKQLLLGKRGTAETDFMLNNNGIAYGKINIDSKRYRAYISRLAKYETDVLPEFIPGQTPNVSEAQRNLDTIAEMQENPCIVKKGTTLSVAEVDSMIPRVVMLKNGML